MLGHTIGEFITQHARDSSGLLGAGELRQPWPLQEGDPRCPLDGIHLQLPQGSTSWGMSCTSHNYSKPVVQVALQSTQQGQSYFSTFCIHLLIYFFIKGEKNWLELLELADQAIDGLPFHQHLPIVKECVLICSYLYDLKTHTFFQCEVSHLFCCL